MTHEYQNSRAKAMADAIMAGEETGIDEWSMRACAILMLLVTGPDVMEPDTREEIIAEINTLIGTAPKTTLMQATMLASMAMEMTIDEVANDEFERIVEGFNDE